VGDDTPVFFRSSGIGCSGSSRPLDDRPDDTSPSNPMRSESVRANASGGVPVYHLPVISGCDMRLHFLIVTILVCVGTSAIAQNSPTPEAPEAGAESVLKPMPMPVPKPVPRARWSEDWSTLRDITPLEDASPPTGYRIL
jgi:hypothetical protein